MRKYYISLTRNELLNCITAFNYFLDFSNSDFFKYYINRLFKKFRDTYLKDLKARGKHKIAKPQNI